MDSTVPLVHYLFTRLRQFDIEAVHGVAGACNHVTLHHLREADLKWVEDVSELNAGYAADGYARVKGMGALMTVCGVGELSAINAIAGSYAEHVPVVHIVGSPTTAVYPDGRRKFKAFTDTYEPITVAQATLNDATTAPALIDACIQACWVQSRPVYLELAADMLTMNVDSTGLKTAIDRTEAPNNEDDEEKVVQIILDKIYNSTRTAFLIDGLVGRHRLIDTVDVLIRNSGIPTFVSPMGKGCVNESLINYFGVYAGNGSLKAVRDFVGKCDLIICLGTIKSDFDACGFTYNISSLNSIDMHEYFVTIDDTRFDVHMVGVIKRLTWLLDPQNVTLYGINLCLRDTPIETRASTPSLLTAELPRSEPGNIGNFDLVIKHDWLWSKLSRSLKPNDIFITEAGMASIGVWDTKFPRNTIAISQTVWRSAGYSLPAAQGAAMASRELGSVQRVIVFIDSGNFQFTAPAISTMLKHHLDITIYLINNDSPGHKDVLQWEYTAMPKVMGGKATSLPSPIYSGPLAHFVPVKDRGCKIYTANNMIELEELWAKEDLRKPLGMHFVEVHMRKEDAPFPLRLVRKNMANTNKDSSFI